MRSITDFVLRSLDTSVARYTDGDDGESKVAPADAVLNLRKNYTQKYALKYIFVFGMSLYVGG